LKGDRTLVKQSLKSRNEGFLGEANLRGGGKEKYLRASIWGFSSGSLKGPGAKGKESGSLREKNIGIKQFTRANCLTAKGIREGGKLRRRAGSVIQN